MMSDRDSSNPDAAAAHELLCELRTRISTQPLPYQYGVEARALESLWEVFALARTAMKNHPGCEAFASLTTHMLNVGLRPCTAKWHRAHEDGRLQSRDGANEFRADLAVAQRILRDYADQLHQMAYQKQRQDDETPPAMPPEQVEMLMKDLSFGIAQSNLLTSASKAEEINADEAKAVLDRRKQLLGRQDKAVNAIGLGLSGGGIRSASFCLGVVQTLAGRGLLDDVDYLSTVSGGGYVGAFLTQRMAEPEGQSAVANPRGPDTPAIRYLRQHAKFLSVDRLLERWIIACGTLAGMLLNWTAPLFVISLMALALAGFDHALTNFPWRKLFVATCGIAFLSLLFHAWRLRAGGGAGKPLALATGLAAAIGMGWWFAEITLPVGGFATTLTALLGAMLAIITRFVAVLRNQALRRLLLKAALVLAGALIPLGAFFAVYWLRRFGLVLQDPSLSVWNVLHHLNGICLLGLITVIFGAVSVFLLDINMTAPHRLYRDRLARTFVQSSETDTKPVPLNEVNPHGRAPYHLINATVNLPLSTHPALRERKCDFFLFSKYWCGAPSSGYQKTSEWTAGHQPVDLATAMAVSGAAVSPHMGLGSVPSLSALLTFLNIRLDYWIRNPKRTSPFAHPGFVCLLREMTTLGMSEQGSWLNLSDGGHIENTAIYELLRRRCKFIISVDGEADPESTFQGHLRLVRHALIDFGIRIEPDLNLLRPDAARFSQSHTVMCRVHYPKTEDMPEGIGLLLYLKSSVTGDESELIKRYRTLNPEFPHQTTLDQFFDEEQFEAYRQLGVHVAEGLFSPALVSGAPGSIHDWFRQLAQNLLLPEGGAMSA